MMWHYFIGSSKIKTVYSAHQKALNSHQTLFLVRGWGRWKMAVLAGSYSSEVSLWVLHILWCGSGRSV